MKTLASDITLADKKLAAQFALQRLVAQCNRELCNLARFEEDDARMLVATADLQYHFDAAMSAADDLQTAFETVLNWDDEVSE